MGLPDIHPPIVNTATPWATTQEQLQTLFDCEHTGAVTIRTSLLQGFDHNDDIHQYAFFDPRNHRLANGNDNGSTSYDLPVASLNTLGYSPITLGTYLTIIPEVVSNSSLPEAIRLRKPFIISVTGSAESIRECFKAIEDLQSTLTNKLCMEINLSCPNIAGKPPPAYSGPELMRYLDIVAEFATSKAGRQVAIGIKTPPYTHHDQFRVLIETISTSSKPVCPIDFITATNTLGSCLVLNDDDPAINSHSGEGIGGMAGAALHPLSLGNVKTIRRLLDEHRELQDITIIGAGGVSDNNGYRRMRSVGASVVGVGTAIGAGGISVFEKILKGSL